MRQQDKDRDAWRIDHDAWVDRLTAVARAGTVLDLTTLPGAPELPAAEPGTLRNLHATTLPEDWQLPAEEAHPPAAHVPASALRQVLLDPELHADARGLWLHGAILTGDLDLADTVIDIPLALTFSHLQATPDLERAEVKWLVLTGSQLPGLSADGLHITSGGLIAPRLVATGEVRAFGVRVKGKLDLQRAELSNPDGDALSLDGAQVTGGLVATGLVATGMVRTLGVRVEGPLDLQRAELSNPDGIALSLDRVQVAGGLFAEGLVATGEVWALGARVEGQLDLQRAELSNPDGVALTLDGAQVGGGVFADDLVATGEVRAIGARVEGQLALQKAQLSNPDGVALNLDNAHVAAMCSLGAWWPPVRYAPSVPGSRASWPCRRRSCPIRAGMP